MDPRLPDLSEVDGLHLDFSIGRKKLFYAETPKGYIFGSRDSDDHITVEVTKNGEDLEQVHRKVNRQEVWRHTQDSIKGEWERFWHSHSGSIDRAVLLQPDTYLLSLKRILLVLYLVEVVVMTGLNLFGRLFLRTTVVRVNRRTMRVDWDFDQDRIFSLLSLLRYPVMIFSRILSRVPTHVYYSLGTRLSKMFLINARKKGALDRDIGFLLSSLRVGLVISSEEGRLSFLPASSLVDLMKSVQSNLPLGNLSEFCDFSGGLLSFEVETKSEIDPRHGRLPNLF